MGFFLKSLVRTRAVTPRLVVRQSSGPKVGNPISDDATEEDGKVMGVQSGQAKTAAGVIGGSVVLYGISSIFYDLAATFMALTPALSLKYGFGFGMISTGSAAAVLWQFERAVYAKPELAFQIGMSLLKNDDNVSSLLGGKVLHTPSDVITYKSRGGSLGVVNSTMTWKSPRIELMFSSRGVHGGHINTLLIMEQRLWGKPRIEFCGADIISDATTKIGAQKRTRLVIKEINANAEETHFAIMDKMNFNLNEMCIGRRM